MQVIGIGYRSGVGKDTAAAHLRVKHGFTQLAFGDHLKSVANMLGYKGEKDDKDRKFLQTVAEASIAYDPYYWTDTFAGRLVALKNAGPGHRKFVIYDVRRKIEADMIKQLGGILVRIDREDAAVLDFESEHYLDDFDGWDYVIENKTGKIDRMFEQLDVLADTLEVIENAPVKSKA